MKVLLVKRKGILAGPESYGTSHFARLPTGLLNWRGVLSRLGRWRLRELSAFSVLRPAVGPEL